MGRAVKGWGESNNTPGTEHTAFLVGVWGFLLWGKEGG